MIFNSPKREQALLVEIYKLAWEDQKKGREKALYNDFRHDEAYELAWSDSYTSSVSSDNLVEIPDDKEILKRIIKQYERN